MSLSTTRDSVRYQYSPDGRFITETTKPMNGKIRYNIDLASGVVNSARISGDIESIYEYGPFGRIVKTIVYDNKKELSKDYQQTLY